MWNDIGILPVFPIALLEKKSAMSSSANNASIEKASNFLQSILKQLGVIGAALYFGGWIYLNRYYSQFDIDMSLLELGWYDVVIYSVALVRNGVILASQSFATIAGIVFISALLCSLYFVAKTVPELSGALEALRTTTKEPIVILTGLVISLFLMFVGAQHIGAVQARKDWIKDKEPIVFGFRDGDCRGNDAYVKHFNDRLQFRLLKATPKWFFVVKQNPDQTASNPLPVRVFHIPTTCIISVRREIAPH